MDLYGDMVLVREHGFKWFLVISGVPPFRQICTGGNSAAPPTSEVGKPHIEASS